MTISEDVHLTGLAERLRAALAEELPAATELRHAVRADPEVSGEETRTVRRVLDAIGAGEGTAVAGTGRLLRVGVPDRPAVAVRGELDGLAGPDGPMHACGHDVHLAAVTALARAAARLDREGALPAPLVTVLQPREERPPSGARDIVADGILQRHDVRAVVGAHVQPLLGAGCIAATSGAVNAAADHVEIVITGVGGHAGYPQLTRDPVLAMAHVLVALQQVVSRRADPLHAVVLSVGTVQAGSAANVIPDRAWAEGTLRVLDDDDRAAAHEEVRTVVENVAAGLGCRGEVVVHEGEPVLVNDPPLTEATQGWLTHLGYDVVDDLRSCGADDFSYYGRVAPGVMMFVGVPGSPTRLHQPSFSPPDETIADVAHALLAGYLGAVATLPHE